MDEPVLLEMALSLWSTTGNVILGFEAKPDFSGNRRGPRLPVGSGLRNRAVLRGNHPGEIRLFQPSYVRAPYVGRACFPERKDKSRSRWFDGVACWRARASE